MGRNGGLLLGPRCLNGVALVQLSQNELYLVTTAAHLQGSGQLIYKVLATMWPDVLFRVHAKKFCFHHRRIRSYTLFLVHHNDDDVIMRCWHTYIWFCKLTGV